jgi:tRNA pseudouridine55 synthase
MTKEMSEIPSGLLNIDKPEGRTSRDVVNRIQWLLRKRIGVRKIKVGHCGTLDPLATGVLVLGVGSSTRLMTRVQQHRKTYSGTFLLGCATNTDDVTGETIRETPIAPGEFDADSIRKLLPEFTGRISQVPPVFSAVHVDGKRAYELARKGKEVEIAPREVDVYSLEVTRFDDSSPPEFDLCVECGSGTYIRSLGRDIGERLGCGATMSALSRSGIGPFELQEAVPLGELDQENILDSLQPSAVAVCHLPTRILDEEETRRIRSGRDIPRGSFEPPRLRAESADLNEEVALLSSTGELIAVGAPGKIPGTLKPATVFHGPPDPL